MSEKICNFCLKSDVCGYIGDFLKTIKEVREIQDNNPLMMIDIACEKFAPNLAVAKRTVSAKEQCVYCEGSGFDYEAMDSTPECNQYNKVKCPSCDGTGKKRQ